MSTATAQLPLAETIVPDDQPALIETVRRGYVAGTPMYPLGGGTALSYGLSPSRPGWGLSLEKLSRVVDYPARDMTITVEAGIRMEELARTLAGEQQWLPVDVAQAAQATLGGVIATNFSGPRRYGQGTIRDYVIGITAIDGRGTPFHGGGRVVKNVAGYDFCKLLTGSLGTLAVISQVTLKVKPQPAASAWLTCELADAAEADRLLDALVNTATTPTAIELLAGPAWKETPELTGDASLRLAVGLEGTREEVDWMREQLGREWREQGVKNIAEVPEVRSAALWSALTEFAAVEAPLVLKFNVLPSAVTGIVTLLRQLDPGCSVQAHAGNGIVVARFREFSPADASKLLIKQLQPAAVRGGGAVVVWYAEAAGDLTRQATWGPVRDATAVMRSVKQQFDPKDLLNPGRFVYGT